MKCPYQDNFDCPFVNTLIMEKSMDCNDCEYNSHLQISGGFLRQPVKLALVIILLLL